MRHIQYSLPRNNELGRQRESHIINDRTFLSLIIIALVFIGCDNVSNIEQTESELVCTVDTAVEGCEAHSPTPAHSPQCIAVDGELCLLSFAIEDGAPRPGTLTPNEPFRLSMISVFNAGAEPIDLLEASAELMTEGLVWLTENQRLSLSQGSAWTSEDMSLTDIEFSEIEEACEQGRLSANAGCTFIVSLPLQVAGNAPTNAVQRIEIAVETRKGARFEWDLPLLVVDALGGLSLGEIRFEESSDDGLLHLGDRLRINQIELFNRSLAPFERLRGLLNFEQAQVTYDEERVIWSEESTSGMLSDTEVNCPAAQLDQDGLSPSRCVLSFSQPLTISPQLTEEELRLMLYLRDQDETVSQPHELNFELSPWAVEFSLAPIELASDVNRDRLASPGERVSIRQLILENHSDSAISFRGRVSVDSEDVEVSSSSDLSINETTRREDFFESCPAQASCPLDVNLILDLSEELEIGEPISFLVELMDQSGVSYQLETTLEVALPDIQLILADFEVSQDTLDSDLSGGERGVISYLKIVNDGLADATDLTVHISTESPWISFEDNEALIFDLNTQSDLSDERSGDCPSLSLESDAYCYRRLELFFIIDEEAPLGTLVEFQIEVIDRWGVSYPLAYSITLF